MTARSRYMRPDTPRPMQLTLRDREVLAYVYRHRYLTSAHVEALAFASVSRRVAQERLRLLWENGYLDRYFTPLVLTGIRQSTPQAARPIYSLTPRGAQTVAEELGLDTREIPAGPARNAVGFATLQHHLVATDFMVALTVACRAPQAPKLACIESEEELRRAVRAWEHESGVRLPKLMSDGAVTLTYGDGSTFSYHLEVVRADVRGGNRTFVGKAERYVQLNREGHFARVFGHGRLRAVLIATPTQARAQRLRSLIGGLPHGRRLFWFCAYGTDVASSVPATSFTSDTVLAPRWRVHGSESMLSLADPRAPLCA